MALVRRVNTNNPLLNTFYCKCIISIGFKTQQTLKVSNPNSGTTSFENHKTFKEMIEFRQNQAKRSVLVKLNSFDRIPYVTKYISQFGNILNVFPYKTIQNYNWVLMELESEKHMKICRNLTGYLGNSECAYSRTPLFSFGTKICKKALLQSDDYNIYSFSTFKIPTEAEIKKKLQLLKSVSDQMITLHKTLKVTDLNIRLRFYTAEQLTYYLSNLFTNMHVVPFGSSVNGFGQIGCDLDLLCKAYPKRNYDKKELFFWGRSINFTDRIKQKKFLIMLSNIMEMCIPGIDNITNILEARVPIIKFFNRNTNMQCDLSNTNITLDWRVKPLVCTIRKWASNAQVTNKHSGCWITNFSLTLLIIFYLQMKQVLPSLNALKVYAKHNDVSTTNALWFLKWKKDVTYNNEESLYSLLYGFFEYYSTFDFQTQAICVREAKINLKKDTSPLYIYNPFDPMLNVSKNITTVEMLRIIEQFQNALYILTKSEEHNAVINLIDSKQSNIIPIYSAQDNNKQASNECNNKVKQSQLVDEELLASESNAHNLNKI
ncbi:unnamed protein product [Xylocopa violacea]|uniref:Poly(A) RNA polymerase, mitochondrial n=1 Tax=Xylocopa violacea TaxID=135666 RepID=A0ABP1MWV8_XYLVO